MSKCIYKSSLYIKHVVHTLRIVKRFGIKYYEGNKRTVRKAGERKCLHLLIYLGLQNYLNNKKIGC